MSKQVTVWEIVDHGVDHAQYFPGQGVCNTEFTDVATGTGATYVEALDDTIEQLATGGWDVDLLAAAEAMHPDADTFEIGLEDDEEEPNNEVWYYVSVMVRGDEDDQEPQEGDYTTTDHEHWHEHGTGKLLLLTTGDDYREQINAHMEREGFYPNAWFLSDHGNFHRITL